MNSSPTKPKPKPTLLFRGALVTIVLVVVILKAFNDGHILSFVDPGPIDNSNHFQAPTLPIEGKPLIWWLSRDYLTQASPPAVVVFGSSQIGGMRSADAKTAGRKLDITLDHRGYTIESQLKELTGKHHNVFVAQLPGTLVCDFYVMSEAWFKQSKEPKAVVVTLSARDFLNDSRPYIGSSESFRCLSPFTDLGDLKLIAYPTFQSKVNWLISSRMMPRLNMFDGECKSGKSGAQKQVHGSVKPDQIFFEDKDRQTYLKMEYPDKAYRSPDRDFSFEMLFLSRLLDRLEQKKIKTFVVGMPLFTADRAEIDKECWAKFVPTIASACKKHKATFLDLTDSKSFSKEDFLDPVHLGVRGGEKLALIIGKLLAETN